MPVLRSIHLAKATRLPMRPVEAADVEAGRGIVGDRYHGTRHRHVTLQSRTALAAAAAAFGAEVPEDLTRRNLTIDEGEVPRDPGTLVRVGPVLLEVVRVAAPCKLLDDTIGRGAQEALRRRGGTVFRVLVGGRVRVGDAVDLAVSPSERPFAVTADGARPVQTAATTPERAVFATHLSDSRVTRNTT